MKNASLFTIFGSVLLGLAKKRKVGGGNIREYIPVSFKVSVSDMDANEIMEISRYIFKCNKDWESATEDYDFLYSFFSSGYFDALEYSWEDYISEQGLEDTSFEEYVESSSNMRSGYVTSGDNVWFNNVDNMDYWQQKFYHFVASEPSVPDAFSSNFQNFPPYFLLDKHDDTELDVNGDFIEFYANIPFLHLVKMKQTPHQQVIGFLRAIQEISDCYFDLDDIQLSAELTGKEKMMISLLTSEKRSHIREF